MSFFPLPDCDWPDGDPTTCDKTIAGESACECDDIEACAVHITGCLEGCTGSNLFKLTQFYGCFAGPKEGSCKPSKRSSCVEEAGLNHEALVGCLGDRRVRNAACEYCLPLNQRPPVCA